MSINNNMMFSVEIKARPTLFIIFLRRKFVKNNNANLAL